MRHNKDKHADAIEKGISSTLIIQCCCCMIYNYINYDHRKVSIPTEKFDFNFLWNCLVAFGSLLLPFSSQN